MELCDRSASRLRAAIARRETRLKLKDIFASTFTAHLGKNLVGASSDGPLHRAAQRARESLGRLAGVGENKEEAVDNITP